jgi:hypothetical protein
MEFVTSVNKEEALIHLLMHQKKLFISTILCLMIIILWKISF